MIEKAKTSFASVKEKLGELKSNLWDEEKNEIINEFKDKGEQKITEFMEMMNKDNELFKNAGFEISSINASLGLPPDLSVTFKYLGSIPAEERDAILLKIKENKLALIILKSLFKACDFSESIRVGQFNLNSVIIKLGLIPAISISLSS